MQFLGFLLVLSYAIVIRGLPRIQNNIEVSIADHPYVVSLQYDSSHVCGGSILNDQWILTAGHCLLDREPELFKVAAGSNSLARPEVIYSVESVIINENYELSWDRFKLHDIGLVHLSEKIHFNNNIKSIALPDQDITNYNQYANFVGWSTYPGASWSADQLHRVDMILDPPKHCFEFDPSTRSDVHICILDPGLEDLLAFCPGDDGGPLVVNGVLVGIGMRYGLCQTYIIPLTRVWHYKNWIERTIENSSPKSSH